MKTSPIELGIALLLPEHIKTTVASLNAQLGKQLPGVENKANQFHITLYQGQFKRTDIQALRDKLKELGHNTEPFSMMPNAAPKQVRKNILWHVQPNDLLQKLHKSAVETFSKCRSGIVQRYQDRRANLPEEQWQTIDQYGMPNDMSYFKPHITLYYALPEERDSEDIVKTLSVPKKQLEFSASSLGLGKLGYDGKVEEWFQTVPLEAKEDKGMEPPVPERHSLNC